MNLDLTEKASEIINKKYDNLTYFDLYGGAVLGVGIATLLLICGWLGIKGEMQAEKTKYNFQRDRCNPMVIPFAGAIVRPTDKSWNDFTAENLTYCVNTTLENVGGYVMAPLQRMAYIILSIKRDLTKKTQYVRVTTNRYSGSIGGFIEDLVGRFMNALVPFTIMSSSVMDLIAKLQGFMKVIVFVFITCYFLLLEALAVILNITVWMLITLAIIFFIMIVVAWFYPVAAIYAAIAAALWAVLVALAMFMAIGLIQIGVETPETRSMGWSRMCFAKGTLIYLKNRRGFVHIEDIRVGDVLEDGGAVTTLLTCSGKGQAMYVLNGTFVTGDHYVEHDGKWITVKTHPSSLFSRYCDDTEMLYCLNVTNKAIIVNGVKYADWDDIMGPYDVNYYSEILEDLGVNVNVQNTNIHQYFECGFSGDTVVKMSDGGFKKIKDVKIGDRVSTGENSGGSTEVTGLVTSGGADVEQMYWNLGDEDIKSLKNVVFVHPDTGREMSTMRQYFEDKYKKVEPADRDPLMYHLLIRGENFKVGRKEVLVCDYNAGLDFFQL